MEKRFQLKIFGAMVLESGVLHGLIWQTIFKIQRIIITCAIVELNAKSDKTNKTANETESVNELIKRFIK